jgi:GMC oxidoreductase/FAD binding domain
MLIDAETIQDGTTIQTDVAVVGAGPAGIVLALELSKAGYDVALIESGRLQFSEAIQKLADANQFDSKFHAPMSECTRRQVGGTSTLWGGRCVPYDPVDFDQRDYIPHSSWPVTYKELEGYFQKASDYFLCGSAKFSVYDLPHLTQKSIVPGLADDDVLNSTLERWSLPTNFGKEYAEQLRLSPSIQLLYGLTCTNIESQPSGNQVQQLQGKTIGGRGVNIKARKYILSGGTLNLTRLLLNSDQYHPGGIGNHSGLLGKFYMGHLSGDIANICFTTDPKQTIYGFDRDLDDVYVRRRFSFTREFLHEQKLSNIVAWLGVPKFGDPSHRSGILSAAYLALNLPWLGDKLTAKAIKKSTTGDIEGVYQAHLTNVLRNLGQTLTFVPEFGYRRYIARRKIPGLFPYSAANEYPLHYHAEQIPNINSHVYLSNEQDALGMRRLNVDLRFCDRDVAEIIRAHQYWDEYLRRHNCGHLKYLTDDLEASIWSQARDGFHQVGTTRMSAAPQDGVVDVNCQVYGFEDLFISSSSIFVTAGQANSTFMIVAFGLRLVDHLKQVLS